MIPRTYRLSDPLSPFVVLRRHFALITQMAKRDVSARYRGSFIGMIWSFVNPMFMLVIYTFVFGFIFKSHWSAQVTSPFEYAVMMFAGLNMNQVFTECANSAPSLIVRHTSFVKKVVFPLESLSWSTIGASLFQLLVSTIALLVVSALVNHAFPWTIVLFPLIVVCFVPFVAGVIWLFASLGVFLRDLQQFIVILTTAVMFLAPILYPVTLVPEPYRFLLYLNPLTVVTIASQDTLILGQQPNWAYLGCYFLVSCAFAWLAFVWFERTKKGFADVL